MRQRFKVFDADTHVNPAADVLDRYVESSFRPRLSELALHRRPFGPASHGAVSAEQYRVGTKAYRRILGEAEPDPTFAGRSTQWKGSQPVRLGVQDDRPENRVKDMDDEGTDVHFLIPAGWTSVVGLDDVGLEVGLIRAYHRYMADFCALYPERLKGLIVASTRDIDEAVRSIREWGTSRWAVAVMPLLSLDMPVDHPSLEPIWKAAQDHDLAVMHHSFTWNPPYFPGYQDLWDNIFLGQVGS